MSDFEGVFGEFRVFFSFRILFASSLTAFDSKQAVEVLSWGRQGFEVWRWGTGGHSPVTISQIGTPMIGRYRIEGDTSGLPAFVPPGCGPLLK